MKFKPYTNRTFEVVLTRWNHRQIDPQRLYFTYILDFDMQGKLFWTLILTG